MVDEGGCRDAELLRTGARGVEGAVDERDQRRTGAALVERALRVEHGDRTGVGDGEWGAHRAPPLGATGQGDEGRLLRFAQVHAGVATGLRGGTERADQVVDELEREAEVGAARGERRGIRLVGTGEHGAGGERGGEGVDGRLVVSGRDEAVVFGLRVGGRMLDIGELSRGGDENRVVEQIEKAGAQVGGQIDRRDQPGRLIEEHVAREDRRRLADAGRRRRCGAVTERATAELPGDVRHAATHRVVVDHVVVDDERGVQQLERRGDGCCGIPAPVGTSAGAERREHERGTEALPAGCRADHRGREVVECVAEPGPSLLQPCQGGVDRVVDGGASDRGDAGDHGAALAAVS